MSQSNNANKKKYNTLSSEYVNGVWEASVNVRVTKQDDKWVNIGLSVYNGKPFVYKDKKGMSMQLRRPAVKELIQRLEQALELQENEWNQQQQAEGDDNVSFAPTKVENGPDDDDW